MQEYTLHSIGHG